MKGYDDKVLKNEIENVRSYGRESLLQDWETSRQDCRRFDYTLITFSKQFYEIRNIFKIYWPILND